MTHDDVWAGQQRVCERASIVCKRRGGVGAGILASSEAALVGAQEANIGQLLCEVDPHAALCQRAVQRQHREERLVDGPDRKSTRLNSSHT